MKKLIKQVIFAFAVSAIPHLSNGQQSQVPETKNLPIITKEEDGPPTKSELKEVLFTPEEVESIVQMTKDYWTNVSGKTLEEILKDKKFTMNRSSHRRGQTRRQLRDECNPFHVRWWKRL